MMETENRSMMEELVRRIAREIKAQTTSFEHFRNFDVEKHAYGLGIDYSNNVQFVPNPEYEELVRKEKELDKVRPFRLRRPIHRRIPSYPEKDGIDLEIRFVPPEDEKSMMRVVLPYTRIGGWAVEVSVLGADTREIRDIRRIIYSIIDREKEKFKG
jgi:hypothetical protein